MPEDLQTVTVECVGGARVGERFTFVAALLEAIYEGLRLQCVSAGEMPRKLSDFLQGCERLRLHLVSGADSRVFVLRQCQYAHCGAPCGEAVTEFSVVEASEYVWDPTPAPAA